MTARAMGADRERCLEAGMDDHVAKPVNRRDLAEAIYRHTYPVAGSDQTCSRQIAGTL